MNFKYAVSKLLIIKFYGSYETGQILCHRISLYISQTNYTSLSFEYSEQRKVSIPLIIPSVYVLCAFTSLSKLKFKLNFYNINTIKIDQDTVIYTPILKSVNI